MFENKMKDKTVGVIVSAIFCSLLSVLARADVPAKGLPVQTIRSWDDLQKLIRQRQVKSVDELIDVLPVDFRKGYSLIYRTQALHRELVSPARPRVLMFGTTGTFMMTYNSHTQGRRARPGEVEGIETVEFKNGEAYFREVQFDGIRDPLARTIDTNPQKCLACHGQSPRGLWDPYNIWPGVYGSLSRGGVDFIKLGTPEYRKFQLFLKEKKSNPRYQILEDSYPTLSERNKAEKLLRPFDPSIMNDALTVADGHTTYPNQRVGMIIGEQNLQRIANLMSTIPKEKKEAYQYLIRGLMLDEKYEDVRKKTYDCAKKVDSFFPATQQNFKPFAQYAREINEAVQADYGRMKSLVEIDNLGLSKVSPGFNSEDPFDQKMKERALFYDPLMLPSLFSQKDGFGGYTVLAYVFEKLGFSTHEMSTAVNSARFNFYYGNSLGCFNSERGEVSAAFCFNEEVEEFFTKYLAKDFFTDPEIDRLSCDQLAAKSREALKRSGL